MNWAEAAIEATEKLRRGETVQIRPRGHSMQGHIEDGELVTIEAREASKLKTGDVVLAQIQGKSFAHIVLHQILECDGEKFLSGSKQGRVDGWIEADKIFGVATKIEP